MVTRWADTCRRLGLHELTIAAGIRGELPEGHAGDAAVPRHQPVEVILQELEQRQVGRSGEVRLHHLRDVFEEPRAVDRERGTRARIGFLTNQPRSFGVTTRLDF